MPHRSPTAADIGKTVEFSCPPSESWDSGELLRIICDHASPTWFRVRHKGNIFETGECRVPYSTPDPIAELSMAADLLAERGADEASKILALFAAMDNSQRNYILRMIEEKDERLRPIEFRMMMQDYGNIHIDRRSLYRPST